MLERDGELCGTNCTRCLRWANLYIHRESSFLLSILTLFFILNASLCLQRARKSCHRSQPSL